MKNIIVGLLLIPFLASCAKDGGFDSEKALAAGQSVVQALTLSEAQVQQAATLSAVEMDKQNSVASASNGYTQRLANITAGLDQYKGLTLSYKVYLSDQINAFAMADGTVRVYSGLMDAMPDDQVLAVIGHEIGHVYLKHSYQQMQQQLLTSSAMQAIAASGGTLAELTQGQLGQLAQGAVKAQFSQQDELDSDRFSVELLHQQGKDPVAMKRAIQTLQTHYGSDSSFLSSHPSNAKRIEKIDKGIGRQK